MSLVFAAYSGARVTMLAGSKTIYLLSMSVWAFLFAFVGIAGTFQIGSASFPWAYPDSGVYSERLIIMGIILTFMAGVSFDLGALLSRYTKHALLEKQVFSRDLNMSRFKGFMIGSLVIVCIGTLAAGGIKLYFMPWMSRAHVVALLTGGDANGLVLFSLVNSLMLTPCFVSALFLIRNPNKKYRSRQDRLKLYVPIAALYIAAALLVSNPISTNRYWFASVYCALALVWILWRHKGICRLWGIVIVIGLVFVFSYASIYRVSTNVVFTIQSPKNIMIHDGDFDAFQQSLNAARYVEKQGHTYGLQTVGAFLFWIPRALWKTKPSSTGELVAKAAGYEYTNLSMPLWAEFYVDWGIAGVIAGFALLGIVSRKLERHVNMLFSDQNNQYVDFGAAMSIFLTPYIIFTMRGDLMPSLAYGFPTVLCMWLVTKRAVSKRENPAFIVKGRIESAK